MLGVQGQALPVPPNAAADTLRATTSEFPDLFLWRVAGLSTIWLACAVVSASAAIGVATFAARNLLVGSYR